MEAVTTCRVFELTFSPEPINFLRESLLIKRAAVIDLLQNVAHANRSDARDLLVLCDTHGHSSNAASMGQKLTVVNCQVRVMDKSSALVTMPCSYIPTHL